MISKKTSRFFLLVVTVLSTSAHATSVEVHDDPINHCVSSSVRKVHDSITNYDNYPALPGATYEASIAGQTIPMIKMIRSQSRFTTKTDQGTDAVAWVVLRPSNLIDESRYAQLYPRFLLHCSSAIQGDNSFTHHCEMDKSREHYGLDDFHSDLTVTFNDSRCAPGQTGLQYSIRMDGNSSHVNAIKAEVLRPLGILAGPVGLLFDEEKFFKSYYVNFYNGWIGTL